MRRDENIPMAQETPTSLGPFFLPHCRPLPRHYRHCLCRPGVVIPSRCSPFPPCEQSLTVAVGGSVVVVVVVVVVVIVLGSGIVVSEL